MFWARLSICLNPQMSPKRRAKTWDATLFENEPVPYRGKHSWDNRNNFSHFSGTTKHLYKYNIKIALILCLPAWQYLPFCYMKALHCIELLYINYDLVCIRYACENMKARVRLLKGQRWFYGDLSHKSDAAAARWVDAKLPLWIVHRCVTRRTLGCGRDGLCRLCMMVGLCELPSGNLT